MSIYIYILYIYIYIYIYVDIYMVGALEARAESGVCVRGGVRRAGSSVCLVSRHVRRTRQDDDLRMMTSPLERAGGRRTCVEVILRSS